MNTPPHGAKTTTSTDRKLVRLSVKSPLNSAHNEPTRMNAVLTRMPLERDHGMPRTWRFRLEEYRVRIELVIEPPTTSSRNGASNQPGTRSATPVTGSLMSAWVAAATPSTPSSTEESIPPAAPHRVIERSEVSRGR